MDQIERKRRVLVPPLVDCTNPITLSSLPSACITLPYCLSNLSFMEVSLKLIKHRRTIGNDLIFLGN